MADAPDSELRVLSFNCWGLKYVSKDRQQRFKAIADELAETSYDVVALQEVWVRADYELIRSKVSSKLPYAKLFYAGALGAGVAILSRYPITETSSFSYTHNGSPIDVASGDWIVGKGLFSVLISHPILDEVEIFNTHMNAVGGDGGHDEVRRISRITAAWELTKRIRHSAALGRHVIVTGDFNSIPNSLVMSIIREHGRLQDSWSISHPHSYLDPDHDEVETPEEALDVYGMTADSPLNTYSAAKHLEGITGRWKGKRLDYVLYRGPAKIFRRPRRRGEQTPVTGLMSNGSSDPVDDVPSLVCTNSRVVMTGKVPGYNMSLSDHFGVEATLFIQWPSAATSSPPPAAPVVWDTATPSSPSSSPNHFRSPSLTKSPSRPYADVVDIPRNLKSPLSHVQTLANVTDDIGAGDAFDIDISQQTVDAMLQAIAGAYREARSRSRKHLAVFGGCVVSLGALIVGSVWQTLPGLNPLLLILGAVLTWLGTTMLYAGFIWGNWELNWLTTVVEELELLNRSRITVVSRQA